MSPSHSSSTHENLKVSDRLWFKILIMVLAFIVTFAILFLIFAKPWNRNPSMARTKHSASETSTSKSDNESLDYGPAQYEVREWNGAYYEPGEDGLILEGLYLAKLPGDSKMVPHYFTEGHPDNSYSGVEKLMNAGSMPYGEYSNYYYIRNGKVDSSFDGLIEIDENHLLIFEHGKARADYNGTLHLSDSNIPVENGVANYHPFNGSVGDEYTPVFWYLDGESADAHSN